MLHRHRPARAPANNNVLQVPSTSSRYGDRAIAVSGPRVWNALSRELKSVTSLIGRGIFTIKNKFSLFNCYSNLVDVKITVKTKVYAKLVGL